MSYENAEAVSENADCKIIEKIIEIRTVVPDDLCNTCFQSCFNSAFSSVKDYVVLASTILQSYAPYIMTFAAGGLIATAASNKSYIVKSSKAIATILFGSFSSKAEMPDEAINKYTFQHDPSSSYISEEIPFNSFVAASEYKSESSFSGSPVDQIDIDLKDQDINLDFTPN